MKQHYHLVSGTVMFVDVSGPEPRAGDFKSNVTLRTSSRNVPAAEIGKAQQTLQMMMFNKLQDPELQVADAHINSISYLGEMTEEEFLAGTQHEPEAEKAPAAPTPIDPRLD